MNGRKEIHMVVKCEQPEDLKTYVPPLLTVLGEVDDVTLGNSRGKPTDTVFPNRGIHHDDPSGSG